MKLEDIMLSKIIQAQKDIYFFTSEVEFLKSELRSKDRMIVTRGWQVCVCVCVRERERCNWVEVGQKVYGFN
jgi:hypothetical protein